jgi:hypothetical protein
MQEFDKAFVGHNLLKIGQSGLTEQFTDFGQIKFPDGGSVLSSSQSSIFSPAASENTWFKSGQNGPKNNHLALLIQIHHLLCRTPGFRLGLSTFRFSRISRRFCDVCFCPFSLDKAI